MIEGKYIDGNYIEAIPAMKPEEAVDILDAFLNDCEIGYVTERDGTCLEHDTLETIYAGIYALRHSEQ